MIRLWRPHNLRHWADLGRLISLDLTIDDSSTGFVKAILAEVVRVEHLVFLLDDEQAASDDIQAALLVLGRQLLSLRINVLDESSSGDHGWSLEGLAFPRLETLALKGRLVPLPPLPALRRFQIHGGHSLLDILTSVNGDRHEATAILEHLCLVAPKSTTKMRLRVSQLERSRTLNLRLSKCRRRSTSRLGHPLARRLAQDFRRRPRQT